ncbi:ADP-ribosylation factor-binding protein GGA2, partial [Eschrichtius robustus]|nr:ADP-ribosylation factor-binding protein GGA2 [Eschrichtius robustus]
EVLQANDLLTQGVLLYKQVMEGRVTFGSTVVSSLGDIPVSRVFQNPAGCMKNCPLIDLEVDSGSEQAGTVAPSILHQDLAALGINDGPVTKKNTPLAQVFVPLESVKPSNLPPLIVYDRNGFRILLHFSQTGAPGHPEVQVLLLTMMSTATQPVWDIMFQVAVPKEPIRLRYKLTFNQGGQPFSEVGEVKDFPDLAVLGAA